MADETTTTTTDNSIAQTPVQPIKPVTPTEDVPVLTQKQADAIMGNTRKEASSAALSALAKELGYETVDDMKAAAKEAKAIKEKNMSDLEKAQQRAEDAEAKATAAELRAVEIEAKRVNDLINNKVISLATAARVEFPDDVVKFLRDHHGDEMQLVVDDKGALNEKLAVALLDKVKTARPSWFAVGGIGSPSHRQAVSPGKQPDPTGAGARSTLNAIKRGGW